MILVGIDLVYGYRLKCGGLKDWGQLLPFTVFKEGSDIGKIRRLPPY